MNYTIKHVHSKAGGVKDGAADVNAAIALTHHMVIYERSIAAQFDLWNCLDPFPSFVLSSI